MTLENLNSLKQCAIRAARAAGSHAQSNFHRRTQHAEKTAHDVKLQLDLECQQIAEDIVLSQFPDHSILGEEGRSDTQGETTWIIDPIDGTVNLSHGMPLWCSSVAVRHKDTVLAGAVYVPPSDELFAATVDEPATCNGKPIHPSTVSSLDESMILTGLSKHVDKNPKAFAQLKAVSTVVQKVRIMGAAAIDICHVACGRADGYNESSIYLWDVAAAGLIARQAGAQTEVLHSYSDAHMHYLCTNGLIHEALKTVVTKQADRS